MGFLSGSPEHPDKKRFSNGSSAADGPSGIRVNPSVSALSGRDLIEAEPRRLFGPEPK